ncbi:MAG: IPT/TIG domain-containing protein [Bacteroidota bacterium]
MRVRVEYIFIACLLIAAACSAPEDYVRDYPQIASSKITSITKTGVIASATISGVHTDQVIDCGFVWDKQDKLTVEKSFIRRFGKPVSNNFSEEITSDLLDATTYYMRAFLQTDKNTIYGPSMKFESLGSTGIVIESVSPEVIKPGDLLTIKGEGFGTDATQLDMALETLIGNGIGLEIKTINETEITTIVPRFFFSAGKIVIGKAGNLPASHAISGTLPTMTDITVTDLCSPIRVGGANLLLPGQPKQVWVNGKQILSIPLFSDGSFTLPASVHAAKLLIGIYYDDYQFATEFTDTTPFPAVASVSSSFTKEGTFVVTGTNFPTCGGFRINPYGEPAVSMTISNVTPTQFTVTILGSDFCSPVRFSLYYGERGVYQSDFISPPKAFTITSISPLSGKSGDHITIFGTSLDGVSLAVSTGTTVENSTAIFPTTQTSTRIDATIVPPFDLDVNAHPTGNVHLILYECISTEVRDFQLSIPPITITNVTPVTSDGYADVVVTGTNFLTDPYIYIDFKDLNGNLIYNGGGMPVRSITATTITFYGPRYATAYQGKYTVDIRSFGRHITSAIQLEIVH